MRIAVWGAGQIGAATTYRLATSDHCSELHWINRTYASIVTRVVDLQHGLAFAPSCRLVKGYDEARAARALHEVELLVLTQGEAVPKGGVRQDVLTKNAAIFDAAVVPHLKDFSGIVLVVTNPVDLLARRVLEQSGLDADRCLGLGTVVETARLRAALAKRLRPPRSPRDVLAYAVGSHDEHFVPVTEGATAMAAKAWSAESIEAARIETVNGAARVKTRAPSTIHPVVEGIVSVVEAIAADRNEILTVSTHDPETGLFYSVPTALGRNGVVERHTDLLQEIQDRLQSSLDSLRELAASLPS
ncbi:MAG TPA: hypothetical protein VJN18_01235 [Polyangiaceae bacterium]|nr:hypothetical protein [Polyangiaceae bacterium]